MIGTRGHAALSICLPASAAPVEAFAASELQRYLGALLAARFEVTTTPTNPCLFVAIREHVPNNLAGHGKLARLSDEGYGIFALNGTLYLVGADERGALYAVYDFLERLGCRFLAPALSFYAGAHEFVPHCETLSWPASQAVFTEPALKYRKLCVEEGLTHTTSNLLALIDWMPKRRWNILVTPLNYAGKGRVVWDNWRESLTSELRRRHILIEIGGHGYENFLNANMENGTLFARHPDWFGLEATAKRQREPHFVFCTSNSEARNYFVRQVAQYLELHPEIDIFDLWPPDGAQWCRCTNCLALGAPGDRQAMLLSAVASAVRRARPSLKLECIAYQSCLSPPARAKLEPNVLVDFCPIDQCFEHPINDPASPKNAVYLQQLKDWLTAFHGDLSIYSYYRKYAWKSLPNIMPHYLQSELRFYRDLGVRGISTYAEPGDWGTYELNHYVLGALAWNPDQSVDELVRQFATARFGRSAGLAEKIYATLEQNVRRYCTLPGTALKSAEEQRRAFAVFSTLSQETTEARNRTAEWREDRALERLELMLEYARRDCGLREQQAREGDPAERLESLRELVGFLRAHSGEGTFISETTRWEGWARRYGMKWDE